MTELDITIVLFIATIAAAFYCGMRYAEYRLIKTMIDMMTDEERDELTELAEKIKADLESKGINDVKVHSVDEEDVVELKHEIMDGVHFLYRDGATFVCQGPSLEDVSKRFVEIMGTKKVGVVTTYDGGSALIIDGKLKGGAEVK